MKNALTSPLARYLIVGGSAFLLDYVTLLCFYYVIGVSLTIATTIGFLSGFIVSFLANRYWVHAERGRQKSGHWQLVEYGLLVVFNYLFTVITLPVLLIYGLQPFIGKIIVMTLITVWNYIIYRKIIFNAK